MLINSYIGALKFSFYSIEKIYLYIIVYKVRVVVGLQPFVNEQKVRF